MSMIGFIIGLIILGLIAGAIARLLVPGRDAMGIGATIVLGIVGSFVGGFLWRALFVPGDQDGVTPAGWIGSIIGAVIVLLVWRAIEGRRGHGMHA
jgi:uncharacterized membrane protein YeaQ/YmgE (transglycosylase-associated protein family)